MTWPRVPLGEVLTKSDEWIALDPNTVYQEVTVRLWGKGVTVRREVVGAEIAASDRVRVRANQFIVSRIDARNGAFGLIPESLDGAVVSTDFPAFTVDAQKLNPAFLNWMSKTAGFVELCKAASEGTTNRVRLKEEKFLAMAIPLPPLAEQQRIVARVDAIASRVTEARRLRDVAVEDAQRLCRAVLRDASLGEMTLTPMRELVRQREQDVQVERDKDYHFAGVYCFGRGVFRGQRKKGLEFSYDRLTTLRSGDFVYPKLMAWEGALAVVPPECDGLVVSTEFPVFEIDTNRVLPEVLDVYFRDPEVWPQLSSQSTGTNVRRQRLNPSDFLAYQFPLPSRQTQERLQRVTAALNKLRPLQAETATELDSLLPSVLNRAFAEKL